MNENKIIAALLTVAINAMRPRATSKQLGSEDWKHVMEDYTQFLNKLNTPERYQEPGVVT